VRVADLYDPAVWERLLPEDRAYLDPFREPLREMVIDTSRFLHDRRDRNVLFEGAQGTLLDLDQGTYPFVSSGISCAAGAAIGGGIGPQSIDRVIGVCKAYSTRVGNGPFPSEYVGSRDAALGEKLREIGREYGVTTGRPRRCGALDLVALRYACRSNSIDALCLTKLDVYDRMAEIQVCTAYRFRGELLEDFPATLGRLEEAEPVLQTLRGWEKDISGCRRFDELPARAREYIDFIEGQAGVPVGVVSVGPERSQTIVRRDPWTPS
jgi:adenylosuccinate synthase